MSDYEEAIERLKKLKPIDGGETNWHLTTFGRFGKISYFCQIGWGVPREEQCVSANGSTPLDAACFAIDQFRNALMREEQNQKDMELLCGGSKAYMGFDPASLKGEATVLVRVEWPDEKPHPSLKDVMGPANTYQGLGRKAVDLSRVYPVTLPEFQEPKVDNRCGRSPIFTIGKDPRAKAVVEKAKRFDLNVSVDGPVRVNLPPAREGRGVIISYKDYTPLTIVG